MVFCQDSKVLYVNLKSGRVISELISPPLMEFVTACFVNENSLLLFSMTFEGLQVGGWNIGDTGVNELIYARPRNRESLRVVIRPEMVSFCPKSGLIALAVGEQHVCVIKLRPRPQLLKTLRAADDFVNALKLSNFTLFVGAGFSQLKALHIPSERVLWRAKDGVFLATINSFGLAEQGRLLLIPTKEGLRAKEPLTGRDLFLLRKGEFCGEVCGSEGQFIAFTVYPRGAKPRLVVFDLGSWREVFSHKPALFSLSSDGRVLALLEGEELRAFEIPSGRRLASLTIEGVGERKLILSPEGKFVALLDGGERGIIVCGLSPPRILAEIYCVGCGEWALSLPQRGEIYVPKGTEENWWVRLPSGNFAPLAQFRPPKEADKGAKPGREA